MAVTRARRHLLVICDTRTVKNDSNIETLVDYIEQQGLVRSALEFSHGLLKSLILLFIQIFRIRVCVTYVVAFF